MAREEVLFFALGVLGTFLLLFASFWLTHRVKNRKPPPCPYTGEPLRYASDIPLESKRKIARFMLSLRSYENRIFAFRAAALSRATGRIFPRAVNLLGLIHVDWNFIQRRYPGLYVSWGSLSDLQKRDIRKVHDSLEHFQTYYSSPHPAPRAIEPGFAYLKPGPLYVDLESKVLVGWISIPDTPFEVLVVQKPIQFITITIPQEKSYA